MTELIKDHDLLVIEGELFIARIIKLTERQAELVIISKVNPRTGQELEQEPVAVLNAVEVEEFMEAGLLRIANGEGLKVKSSEKIDKAQEVGQLIANDQIFWKCVYSLIDQKEALDFVVMEPDEIPEEERIARKSMEMQHEDPDFIHRVRATYRRKIQEGKI